ncbi:competence protein CoiA family protein [Herbidospora sp. RD11066]
MFLTERRGVRFATHHNPSIRDHPSRESDQHKAFKERIAKAAILGGFTAEIEDRARNGRRRTDVLVRGAGGLLVGHEVQLADVGLPSVRRRTRRARAEGITPSWTTVDPQRDFINHVPWAQTDDFPWKYIAEGGDLQIRGGVRALRMTRCNVRNPDPCPTRGHGRCLQLHGTWIPHFPYLLDDLVRDTAAGAFVPVIVAGRRRNRRWWVRPQDRDRYAECGGGIVTEDDLLRAREPKIVAPRPLDDDCRFGQDGGVRTAPRPGHDDDDTDLAVITETTPWPSPPPRPVIRRGVCGSGSGPCGHSPARLYACGWRCEEHRPGLR